MTKIAYNACYGGFSLSEAAIVRYLEIKEIESVEKVNRWGGTYREVNGEYFSDRDIARNDPALIQVIEEMGPDANGSCANLRIAELDAGTLYRIDEYDGNESVVTSDDYDWSVA